MNSAARESHRIARRFAARIPTLNPNQKAIAETGGKINHRGSNHRRYQNHYHRFFATRSLKSAEHETGTLGTAKTNENQDEELTLIERTDKNIIQRVFGKYSMSQQKERILVAESLFQAATSQASDP
jgi:hypothetical protein